MPESETAPLSANKIDLPHVDLGSYIIDPHTIKLVSAKTARTHKLIPLFKIGNTLTIAVSDPNNLVALDDVRIETGLEVDLALASEEDIDRAIDHNYGTHGTLDELIKDIEDSEPVSQAPAAGPTATPTEEAPIIRLVNLIISQAVKEKASDIHLEPESDKFRVRYRVDGILREVSSPPKHLQNAITSRIKVMGEMDISETRVPQDGRATLTVGKKIVDMRISTMPTKYGENVVVRLLDKSSILLGLDQLGFNPFNLERFKQVIQRPYGIVLVTGPTGSGKTTTLYATLNTINSLDKNIITIEDPIEYDLHYIRQSQVNTKAGLTFANGLRAILRQDPDVILVGEIRDLETAEIAIRSALTGHLVFSTLHTNDAPGAITRLIDMGIEPFLVSSSVAAAIAQRLVRKICSKCAEEIHPSEELLNWMDLKNTYRAIPTFYKGKGCKWCSQTGYSGRIAIFEQMIVDDAIRDLILSRPSTSAIKKIAQQNGMKTLRDDGLKKAAEGITTLDEVIRVTQLD